MKNNSIRLNFVGMTRLELATSRPPDACANQLRYIPIALPLALRMQNYIQIMKCANFWAKLFDFFMRFRLKHGAKTWVRFSLVPCHSLFDGEFSFPFRLFPFSLQVSFLSVGFLSFSAGSFFLSASILFFSAGSLFRSVGYGRVCRAFAPEKRENKKAGSLFPRTSGFDMSVWLTD